MVNVGITAYNMDHLGIKAALKTTGKQTAKAMVQGPEGREEPTRPEPEEGLEEAQEKEGNQ